MSLSSSGHTGSLPYTKIMVSHAVLTACPPFSGVTPYSTAQLKQVAAAEHAAAASHTLKQPQLLAAFLNLHLFFCIHCGLGTLDKPAKWTLDSEHFAGSVVAASMTTLLEMQAVSRHPKPAGYSRGQWLMLLAHTGTPGLSKHASSQQARCTRLVGDNRDVDDHLAWSGGLQHSLSR